MNREIFLHNDIDRRVGKNSLIVVVVVRVNSVVVVVVLLIGIIIVEKLFSLLFTHTPSHCCSCHCRSLSNCETDVEYSRFSLVNALICSIHVKRFLLEFDEHELIFEQYSYLEKMTIGIQKRDRCRLCYSLILRDRSTLFSSICCQKYYHLFKPIQRTKLPRKTFLPYSMKFPNRTVCFRDLIVRYLHTEIHSKKFFSNFICYDCSRILLDVEQCAKYLSKTIQQLKRKFNKSNRLVTSSLSATFQKKERIHPHEQLPILNSDEDEEFDDLDDDEVEESKALPLTSKSRQLTSPLSSAGGDSLSNLPGNRSINRTNNGECSHDEDGDDEDDDDDDDDEDEEGLIRKSQSIQPSNLPVSFANPSMQLLDGVDPNEFQLHLARMMANIATAPVSTSSHQNMETMMNTLNHFQRNFLKMCAADPRTMAQAAAAAQFPSGLSAISSPNKQTSSGRKRKSTPEKRVITQNNGDVRTFPFSRRLIIHSFSRFQTSPTSKQEFADDITDHPLELTVKDSQRSTQLVCTEKIVQWLRLSNLLGSILPSCIR